MTDFLFGYGSIINNASRESTASISNNPIKQAIIVELHNSKLMRKWCFRSNTGFTALGLTYTEETNTNNIIQGVLFPLDHATLAQFDIREVGYSRIELSSSNIRIRHDLTKCTDTTAFFSQLINHKDTHIWTYIPETERTIAPDKNYPILQSYIDVCVRGCLEWGGNNFAKEFLLNTFDWSEYYLDDTPQSRRPWIHRKDYIIIDSILKQVKDHINLHHRKHPEDYSATHLHTMTGIWGVPNRQSKYTGRDYAMNELHNMVLKSNSGVVEVVGMGGVGKTTFVAEYCHTHVNTYSLILWFHAENESNIASDMRRFGSEFGLLNISNADNKDDNDDATIVAEVLRRLNKCRAKYLLVFDNVNNYEEIYNNFLPKGYQSTAEPVSLPSTFLLHVIFTTRISNPFASSTLLLSCFEPNESIFFLSNTIKTINKYSDSNKQILSTLADALGHLPLALSMAIAFINSCDISPHEYLQRLHQCSNHKSINLQHVESVSSSLNLTLNRIVIECPEANKLLLMTAYLDVSALSKNLFSLLLSADIYYSKSQFTLSSLSSEIIKKLAKCYVFITTATVLIIIISDYILIRLIFMILLLCLQTFTGKDLLKESGSRQLVKANISSIDYQTDKVWETLKKYSLLTSLGGNSVTSGETSVIIGSIHRLQAAAIRTSITSSTSIQLFVRNIFALRQLWKFDRRDSNTWSQAGEATRHIEMIAPFINTALVEFKKNSYHLNATDIGKCAIELSRLIIDASSYLAFVLSRFSSSKSLLELASSMLNHYQLDKDLTYEVAMNQFSLGRVSRYCSEFSNSDKYLSEALRLFKMHNCNSEIADTFHELGVLSIRKHDLKLGRNYLESSLDIKRQLKSDKSSIATTLHQLAVVETGESNYDEAERLLEECLNIETDQTTSRAATLQQRGRVALRRGLLIEASDYFNESLDIYLTVYGQSSHHLNIAVVYHQLGVTAKLKQSLNEAKEYFQKSLMYKENIYNDGDNVETILEMQSLGEVELSLNNLDTAETFFSRCREASKRLLASFSPCEVDMEESKAARTSLTNSLILATYSLRAVAKQKGDSNRAAALSKDAKIIKRKYFSIETVFADSSNSRNVGTETNSLLVIKLLQSRKSLRAFASSLTQNEDLDINCHSSILLSLCQELEQSKINCSFNEELFTVTDEFVRRIQFCLLQSKDELPTLLFESSDFLRGELRRLGIIIEDTEKPNREGAIEIISF